MEPVLIVGKGPTATVNAVRAALERGPHHVAALNGAVRLCVDRVDTLFVNDLSAFTEFDRWDCERVGRFVLPTELHLDVRGDETIDSKRVVPLLCGRPFSFYRLPTEKRGDFIGVVPCFGRIFSVAETAVAYLLHEGYREFRTLGLDPDGGYAPSFSGGAQVERGPAHYRENWERCQRRVLEAGGSIERL